MTIKGNPVAQAMRQWRGPVGGRWRWVGPATRYFLCLPLGPMGRRFSIEMHIVTRFANRHCFAAFLSAPHFISKKKSIDSSETPLRFFSPDSYCICFKIPFWFEHLKYIQHSICCYASALYASVWSPLWFYFHELFHMPSMVAVI